MLEKHKYIIENKLLNNNEVSNAYSMELKLNNK